MRLGGFPGQPREEIESFLQSQPGVAGVQVVAAAIEAADPVPVAFIRAENGAIFDEAALRALCRERLARFKVPERIVAVNAFPIADSPKRSQDPAGAPARNGRGAAAGADGMSTHAMFLEDFAEGQIFTSSARTITEADLTLFAMLSGDWNPVHVDEEFARTTQYGRRLVHGLYGPAIMTGMMQQLGIFDGSAIAMLNVRELQFRLPLLVGDTRASPAGDPVDAGDERRAARRGRTALPAGQAFRGRRAGDAVGRAGPPPSRRQQSRDLTGAEMSLSRHPCGDFRLPGCTLEDIAAPLPRM